MNNASKCEQYGTATVSVPQDCRGPFTYQWEYSDNGVVWTSIPGGTTQTINTFVPYPMFSTMLGTFNSRQYRVTVSSFIGSTTATGTAYYVCPSNNFIMLSSIFRKNTDFKIYPNPTSNQLNVLFNIEEDEVLCSIELNDINGRFVKKLISANVKKGLNHLNFNIDFEPGVYFIRLATKSKTFIEKLIVQ
ncbi:MAG TPA: T9SS type A sorting domain-containing protein [Edaphocola sp.]|nr:T9SS type A sorting domain-containing protein [Edaphocola sp.]